MQSMVSAFSRCFEALARIESVSRERTILMPVSMDLVRSSKLSSRTSGLKYHVLSEYFATIVEVL